MICPVNDKKGGKEVKRVFLALAGTAFLLGAAAAETNELEAVDVEETDDGGLSVEVSMDVLSDYVWRGTICNGNPVWQPSVTVGYDAGDYGALSANVWSTYDLTHKRGTATNSRRACGLQEFDYTVSYANSLGPVGIEVGHLWYTYPNNNGKDDQELYATLSYENPIVTPSASAFWNYSDSAGNDVSAAYFSFALKRASYAFTEWFSVGAQINYTWTPSHTLRHEGYMGEGKHQLLWGGVNATFSF